MDRQYTPRKRMWPPPVALALLATGFAFAVACRIVANRNGPPEAGVAAMRTWPRDAEAERALSEALTLKEKSAGGESSALPPGFRRGISLGLFSRDPDYDYGPLIEEIAAHGADSVALFFNFYQRHGASTEMNPATSIPVQELILERTIVQSQAVGLDVLLFPVVLFSHPRGTEWRGGMKPDSVEEWFGNYSAHMVRLAALASRTGAAGLCVGSELSSMERHEAHWRDLIRRVRARFRGELSYSANWDHYRSVPFRDALDVFGLSGYYELTGSTDPTLDELTRAWERERDAILAWKRVHAAGQPLVFTEIGYANQDGTNMFPWDYTLTRPPDPREQAMCIEAFVRVWHAEPELSGVYFYNWFGHATAEDRGYSPRAKPAAAVIAAWFGRR